MPHYYAIYSPLSPSPTQESDVYDDQSAWALAYAIQTGSYVNPETNGYDTLGTYVDAHDGCYSYAVVFEEDSYVSNMLLGEQYNLNVFSSSWADEMDILGAIAHWRFNEKNCFNLADDFRYYSLTTVLPCKWLQTIDDDHSLSQYYISNDALRSRIYHLSGTDSEEKIASRYSLEGSFDIEIDFSGFSESEGHASVIGLEPADKSWRAEVGPIYIGGARKWVYSLTTSGVTWSTSSSRTNSYGKLRFERSGNTFRIHQKDGDAETWTELRGYSSATQDVPISIFFKVIVDDATSGTGYRYCLFDNLLMTTVEDYFSHYLKDRVALNHGYYIGDPALEVLSLVSGEQATIATFDGSTEYLDLTIKRAILENAIFSVIGTFKTSYTGGAQTLICALPEGSETNGRGWKLGINAVGNLTFDYGDGTGVWQTQLVSTTAGFNDGVGHNIVLVFGGNGSAITLYIDGSSEIASTAVVAIQYTDNGSGNSAFFGIGTEINSSSALINFFNGSLGDFALTADVVTSVEATTIDNIFNGI